MDAIDDDASAAGPARWARIKSLFARALEIRKDERAAFLTRESPDEPGIRAEVESLLSAHEDSAEFLGDIPADWRRAALADPRRLDSRVGAYRIVELIGSGGMGDVYKAVRDDDSYQAEVAIKIMRRDSTTAVAEKRFRTERQILAKLDHRNIARLLDGGATPDGLPYVVMELVAGERIDAYCDSGAPPCAAAWRCFSRSARR